MISVPYAMRIRFVIEVIVAGLMVVTAFGGFAYACWHQRATADLHLLPPWRRAAARAGLLAVAVQAMLFILSWTRIGRDDLLFGQWARWVLPSFLIAVPFVFFSSGTARWWLLVSSLLLFIMCFFITLSA